MALIFKCAYSNFDRCERYCGHIQSHPLLSVVYLACRSDKNGLRVWWLWDLGCQVWLCWWIDGGLETYSYSKGFHYFFKCHLSLRIFILTWVNSSHRICLFLIASSFVEEWLFFFLQTIWHQKAITSPTTQKGDAPDNQWRYHHRLTQDGADITTNTCVNYYSMTACVDVNGGNVIYDCTLLFYSVHLLQTNLFLLCWTCTSDADVSHHVLHEECRLSTNLLVVNASVSYVERVRQTLTFSHHVLHEQATLM